MPKSGFDFLTLERALLVQLYLKRFDHGHECVLTDGWYQLKQKSDKAEGDIKKLGF